EGVVHTTCRWSPDLNFLLREFTMRIKGQPVTGGTQRIGWDPLTSQFRSWVFDTEGGFSDGSWSRGGPNQWIIKANGFLADGRAASATQILTFVSKGTARWHSVDRTVGGQAVPDLPEIVLVHTPPQPSAASTSALPNSNSARKP